MSVDHAQSRAEKIAEQVARQLSVFRDQTDNFWCNADNCEQFFVKYRSDILKLIDPLLTTMKECEQDISVSQLRYFVYGMLKIEMLYQKDLKKSSGGNSLKIYAAMSQTSRKDDDMNRLRTSAKELLVFQVFGEDKPQYHEAVTMACELYAIHLRNLQDDFRARLASAA